jgi:regulator of sirC expression with transglutaminase-like and TPR domain
MALNRTWDCRIALTGLLIIGCCLQARAQAPVPGLPHPPARYTDQSIWDLPNVPEEKVDLGLWALVIAKEFDPSVDVQAGLDLLDSMAETIRRTLPPKATDWQKVQAVRTFQYDSGAWNRRHPFHFDLTDQIGDSGEKLTLTDYLRTRAGNCVTMPTLFLALMERVAPEVHLAGAITPDHVYLRYHDRRTGKRVNVETTNGGQILTDRTIADQVGGVTDLAVSNGLWMRDVTKKEILARMMEPLALRARLRRNYRMEQGYTLLMLQSAPNLFWSEVAVYTATIDRHDYYCERNRLWKLGQGEPLTYEDQTQWGMLHRALDEAVVSMAERGYTTPAERLAKLREEQAREKDRRRAASAEVRSSQGAAR